MKCRVKAGIASAFTAAASVVSFPAPVLAAELPEVRITESNQVPACVTPGRLTDFLESRNPNLKENFAKIAVDYARIGEKYAIRWDIAFFQMLLETGNLKFTGDVAAGQNNFAGLGATGNRNPGETFPDVATGVTAHLQHLLLYAGEHLDNPVAERTRKVQEWNVLTDWQRTIKGPMTFSQLARQWAPGSRNYVRDIGNIEDAFMDGPCQGPDTKPELTAMWKPESAPKADAKKVADGYTPPKVTGYELAQRANREARSSGSYIRSSLGAGMFAALDGRDAAQADDKPEVKILNAQASDDAATSGEAPESRKEAQAKIQTASLSTGLKGLAKSAEKSKCKVWTASYGGARAVIIKANANGQENYTVLDVNEATAQRETDAYIAAYAKGGEKLGELMSPEKALEKAFNLCPEG